MTHPNNLPHQIMLVATMIIIIAIAASPSLAMNNDNNMTTSTTTAVPVTTSSPSPSDVNCTQYTNSSLCNDQSKCAWNYVSNFCQINCTARYPSPADKASCDASDFCYYTSSGCANRACPANQRDRCSILAGCVWTQNKCWQSCVLFGEDETRCTESAACYWSPDKTSAFGQCLNKCEFLPVNSQGPISCTDYPTCQLMTSSSGSVKCEYQCSKVANPQICVSQPYCTFNEQEYCQPTCARRYKVTQTCWSDPTCAVVDGSCESTPRCGGFGTSASCTAASKNTSCYWSNANDQQTTSSSSSSCVAFKCEIAANETQCNSGAFAQHNCVWKMLANNASVCLPTFDTPLPSSIPVELPVTRYSYAVWEGAPSCTAAIFPFLPAPPTSVVYGSTASCVKIQVLSATAEPLYNWLNVVKIYSCGSSSGSVTIAYQYDTKALCETGTTAAGREVFMNSGNCALSTNPAATGKYLAYKYTCGEEETVADLISTGVMFVVDRRSYIKTPSTGNFRALLARIVNVPLSSVIVTLVMPSDKSSLFYSGEYESSANASARFFVNVQVPGNSKMQNDAIAQQMLNFGPRNLGRLGLDSVQVAPPTPAPTPYPTATVWTPMPGPNTDNTPIYAAVGGSVAFAIIGAVFWIRYYRNKKANADAPQQEFFPADGNVNNNQQEYQSV